MVESKAERDSRYLDAKIDDEGNLVLEGYDIGDTVKEYWGDSDYEYWLTVSQEYKDTVLLSLIQERFGNSSEFMTWLEEKDIPHKFDSWV